MTRPVSTQTRATAEALYSAMGTKDLEAVQTLLSDSVVVEIPGTSGIAGTFHGSEAVLGLFRTLAGHSQGTYRFAVEAITAGDGMAVAVGRATGNANGRDLNQDAVHVLTIEDGRVTSLRAFFADQAMTDAFWS
jgi:ketosteroid isomerase-like protein